MYDDLLSLLEPVIENDAGKFRYAQMLLCGKGVRKNEKQARKIMRQLVRKNNKYRPKYKMMFPD